MTFTASPAGLLERLESHAAGLIDDRWAAEPPAARAALLVREELARWTESQYPGATTDGEALDPGSRRRLSLLIHSAPVSHRVEVWGFAPGDDALPAAAGTGHTLHSWVVVAGVGGAGIDVAAARLSAAGLKKLDVRRGPALAIGLWMGLAAPDGCPDCKAR